MVASELNRLRWCCRRGMREMDLLLGGYLERHYSKASAEHQQAFRCILEELDQDILDWVMQRQPCPPQYSEIIQTLRQLADTRQPPSN